MPSLKDINKDIPKDVADELIKGLFDYDAYSSSINEHIRKDNEFIRNVLNSSKGLMLKKEDFENLANLKSENESELDRFIRERVASTTPTVSSESELII